MRPSLDWLQHEAYEEDIDDLLSRAGYTNLTDAFTSQEIAAIAANPAAGEWQSVAVDAMVKSRVRRAVRAVRKARPAKRRGR
jgi:hypothetical protein